MFVARYFQGSAEEALDSENGSAEMVSKDLQKLLDWAVRFITDVFQSESGFEIMNKEEGNELLVMGRYGPKDSFSTYMIISEIEEI